MVNILAFDTSSKLLSIALKTKTGFFEFFMSQGFKHSENLTTEIASILKTAELKPENIDMIVCPEGPGSFTGLRIGIATAKGLSFALQKPLVTVPTLDMLAYGLDFFKGTVVPILDARKQRFYTALYTEGERISEYLDISPEALINILNDHTNVILTGADAHVFHEISMRKYILNQDYNRGYARNLIPLGEILFEKNGAASEMLGPLYLRKSEAEIGITR